MKPSLFIFFGLAYLISWTIWAPLYLPAFGITGLPRLPYHHALGAIGPITAAFIVAALENGARGPKRLLSSMLPHPRTAPYIAIALFGPFLLLAIAALAGMLMGETDISLAGVGVSREFPQFSIAGFFLYNLITFGIGEETGWRGFALPRLQARHSAFVATLLLTIGWAGWHLPLFLYRPGYVAMDAFGALGWALSLFTGAVLLTWLFNASRGSLFVVALFHATIDIAFTSDIASMTIVNITGALVTIWGIAVLLIYRLKNLAPVQKTVWPPPA